MKSVMKALSLALAIAFWTTQVFAQCSEVVYKEPKEERAALLVDSIEGNALFSIMVNGPSGSSGRASDQGNRAISECES
jgi:hypothetical protein